MDKSMDKPMTDNIMSKFRAIHSVEWLSLATERAYAETLLQKYSEEEIIHAIEYWKSSIYTLKFLTDYRMRLAGNIQETHPQYNYKMEGDTGERNRQKLSRANHQWQFRKDDYSDLFE